MIHAKNNEYTFCFVDYIIKQENSYDEKVLIFIAVYIYVLFV